MEKHYVTQDGKHYLLIPEYKKGWTWQEGASKALSFQTDENSEVVSWGHEYPIDRYVTVPDVATIPVREVSAKGRGYSGGHNTASRLGWLATWPEPDSAAVLWWDATRRGRFTGLQPYTASLVLA